MATLLVPSKYARIGNNFKVRLILNFLIFITMKTGVRDQLLLPVELQGLVSFVEDQILPINLLYSSFSMTCFAFVLTLGVLVVANFKRKLR